MNAEPADSLVFRRVLGHFATGLTIVSAELDGVKHGFTCQSFASVSLSPPLVAFFVRSESRAWAGIRKAGVFAVSILGYHQENLARIFGAPGVDKFKDVETTPSPNGSPVIVGSIAWLDCRIEEVSPAGDHDAVIGSVNALKHTDNEMPLLYFRGGYGVFEP